MKSVRLLGLSLLALLALGAFAAATASAEEGFLPKLATANILGGESILKAGETSITCAKLDASTITFTTDEHGSATLRWLECTTAGKLVGVNSLGDKAKEILAKVLFLVCLDPKNSAGTLLQLFGFAAETDEKEPIHLEEPTVGTLQNVQGRVLGAFLTTEGKLFVVHLNAPGGVQEVALCVKGAEDKTNTLTSEENHDGVKKPATEEVKGGLIQFAEIVKLMDS
jgi:hypothetical protein